MNEVLKIENLSVDFASSGNAVSVLREVSFSVESSECLAIVGESGSGKSVTSLAVMGLLASNGIIKNGSIKFKNKSLLSRDTDGSAGGLQKLRGDRLAMIFQDPMSSLHPCFTIGEQIEESLIVHTKLGPEDRKRKVYEILSGVGIANPEIRYHQFPHEFSGGMCQRVMIAIAMVNQPDLIIADEPTTALDVTVQKQVLDLLSNLQKKNKMAMILISHDLGLVGQYADRIAVMYAGEIVEIGSTLEILSSPRHPYTSALIRSLPYKHGKPGPGFRLPTISGIVPSLSERPPGCQFEPRCDRKVAECASRKIPFEANVRCIRPIESQNTSDVRGPL